MIGAMWGRWVEATSRTEGPETMALFRIGIGLTLMWTVVTAWTSGAVDLVWTDAEFGGYRSLHESALVGWLGGASPRVVHGLLGGSLLGGALVAVGLGGRGSAFFALQAFIPIARLNSHANGSFEHLLTNALWLLVLCRATGAWSVDQRIARRRPPEIGVWARWLVLAQVILVYGTTGLQKTSSSWTPLGGFSAIYQALRDPAWQRVDLPWLGWLAPLLAVSTAAVWLFEIGWLLLPLLLWWRATDRGGRLGAFVRTHDPRPAILAFGLAMHLGILALMQVGGFSVLTLCFYVALWRPDEIRGWTTGRPR